MKKSNFLFGRLPFYKMGFLSFLLTFLFFAGTQADMKAQIYVTDPTPPGVPAQKTLNLIPVGTFVTVEVAKIRLGDALLALKQQLGQFAPGSAQYENAYRRYAYYSEILSNLNDGKTVAESISISIGRLTVSEYPPALATPEQALAEKNAAINLLS